MLQRSAIVALSFSLLMGPGASSAGVAAAAPAAAVPADGGWPRTYITSSGAKLVLYEPQVASWTDQKRMVMYAAASHTARDQQTSALGTIRIEANTRISTQSRLISFSDFAITASHFPTLPPEQLTTVVQEFTESVPREERVIGLDRVLAGIDTSEVTPRNVDGVKADPPAVFYSTTSAVLVSIDGEPIWSPLSDNDLRFAVNTNWDLFEHVSSSSYVLRIDNLWLKASRLDGPWTPAGKLADSFSRLPNDDSWKAARAALGAGSSGQVPVVFISRKPAELILLRGSPAYEPVPGTGLLWVSNTDSDVFRAGKKGTVYYLVSGRWFSAPDFTGPWTFATTSLPEDFKKIPLEHSRSRVLASVPGTTQALEAVLLAQVPQTARVSRTQVTAPEVVYQGEPQFEDIENTEVARAVNTDKDVLQVGMTWRARYYMCADGVWFVATAPAGPWTLADAIPKEIYQIPINSPAYGVTSVTVESADEESVVFAAQPGYSGMMVAWGCTVWGTGWYYPPYVGWGGRHPVHPVYFPRYFGYSARYNPWNASYTRSAGGAYGPYGGAGYAARYDPQTRRYARGTAAWGAGPRGSRYATSVYASWGSTAVQRGDHWAQAARITAGTGAGRDVFAGHDGNVYRNQGGSWQRYDTGGWNAVNRPTVGLSSNVLNQLNHDLAARRAGSQRTLDLGSITSGSGGGYPGGPAVGSYRPNGSLKGGVGG